MAAQAAPPPPPPPARRPPRSRLSSGVTLVTGVATLLLAMGVGVLIGHDSSAPAPQRAAAQVITVNGSGSASAGGATNGKKTKKSAHTAAKSAKALGIKPTVVKLNKKTVQAAAQAATKVFGHQGNLAPPTVKVGQACAHGAGCQGEVSPETSFTESDEFERSTKCRRQAVCTSAVSAWARAGGASGQLGPPEPDSIVDLRRRRDALNAHVAELQFDLGGLVYRWPLESASGGCPGPPGSRAPERRRRTG